MNLSILCINCLLIFHIFISVIVTEISSVEVGVQVAIIILVVSEVVVIVKSCLKTTLIRSNSLKFGKFVKLLRSPHIIAIRLINSLWV